ncbi:hypothetical protein [Streptomyces sp. NPDC058045]|uniref:hypothetical protein n=1 Tax=Streptomyces sp. NPDC058045 TaxID=3346311 RepID=UPI0036E66EC9
MTSNDEASSRFFAEHFRPRGVRLGILLLAGYDPAIEETAAGHLQAHGLTSARRLARLHPLPGDTAVTSSYLTDFLARYGHEYAAAWLPTTTADGHPLDRPAIDTAAHTSGCPLGWYRPGI